MEKAAAGAGKEVGSLPFARRQGVATRTHVCSPGSLIAFGRDRFGGRFGFAR